MRRRDAVVLCGIFCVSLHFLNDTFFVKENTAVENIQRMT